MTMAANARTRRRWYRTAIVALSMATTMVPARAQVPDLDDDMEMLARQRRARETLYTSMPPDRWHFQIDSNSGHGFVLANCQQLFCGAFYRAPPIRFTVLSMVAHPLRLSVVREDCLSAGETWRSSSRIADVETLPISMVDLRSAAIALIRRSNATARRRCGARAEAPVAALLRSLPGLRRRFIFADDGRP